MNRDRVSRAKLYFAVLGFCLTAAGIALDSRPLVWAAIVVLSAAMGLRLWLNRQRPQRNREDLGEPNQ